MEQGQHLLSNELQVDNFAQAHLKETAMWAKLLGIVGFVMSALLGLFSFFAGTIFDNMSSRGYAYDKNAAAMGATTITVVYLIFAAIGCMVSLFTYRFAVKMKAALVSSDQTSLIDSFKNLKLLFRVYGVIALIYIFFIAMGLLFGGLGAILSGGF